MANMILTEQRYSAIKERLDAHKMIMSEIVPGSGVTPEFAPFLNDFNELAYTRVRGYCQAPIDVGFGNLKNLELKNKSEGQVVGLCIGTKRPMVLFDREYWHFASPVERQMLALHEFGHCLLNLEHNEAMIEIDNRKQPASLMHPSLFGDNLYIEMKDYYINELFLSTPLKEEDFKEACSDGKN
jgi:hypothetical protein